MQHKSKSLTYHTQLAYPLMSVFSQGAIRCHKLIKLNPSLDYKRLQNRNDITMKTTFTSVLIIGATGRTGIECVRQLASHTSKPKAHAFCRDSSKLSEQDKALCTSIVEGDARKESDLEHALRSANADVVIVCIGNGDSVSKTDIRTASAEALARVMLKAEFNHIHALVVSSTGAGSSKIIVGMGIGSLVSFHLRHVLKDHTGQEAAFRSVMKRTTIVRPTTLTDNEPTGKLVKFGDRVKAPTLNTDRKDVAAWVAQEVLGGTKPSSHRVVNLTGVKC